MNCASVDRFLEDEVKLRTLSGVGMTFDLALNKPASMVALAEAVKFYEVAGEEYETVYGNQHSHDERLHFTDMRRGALENIVKDFEARGLKVFQVSRSSANGTLCHSLVCYGRVCFAVAK
jgi:hypothetical protein